MDKSKNRTDLLAAGRKKLQQFRQKKDPKGAKSGKVGKKDGGDAAEETASVPNDAEVDRLAALSVGEANIGSAEEHVIDGGELRSNTSSDHQEANYLGIEQCNGERSGAGVSIMADGKDVARGTVADVGLNKDEVVEVHHVVPSSGLDVGQEYDGSSVPIDENCKEEAVAITSSMMIMENGRDKGSWSSVDFTPSITRMSEDCFEAPTMEFVSDSKVDWLSAPTEVVHREDDETIISSRTNLEMGSSLAVSGDKEHVVIENSEVGTSEVNEEAAGTLSSQFGIVQRGNLLSIPVEDTGVNTFNKLEEHVSDGEHLQELASTQDSFATIEECVSRTDNAELGGEIDDVGTEQPSVREDVVDNEPMMKPSGGQLILLEEEKANEEDSLFLMDNSSIDRLDSLTSHLYLTNVAKDFLQMQLAEVTESHVEAFQHSSHEVSRLCGFVKEAEESKGTVCEELMECRSELQAVVIEKEKLENQCSLMKEEINQLRIGTYEVQSKLDHSQEELSRVSVELADRSNLLELLQKENLELAARLVTETDARKKLMEENTKLASELSEQKDKLLIALNNQMQLEGCLNETGACFEEIVMENMCLSCSLVVHEAKIKEMDGCHSQLPFQNLEDVHPPNNSIMEGDRDIDVAFGTVENSGALQKDDHLASGSSVPLGVLKEHLEEAKNALDNLEKAIQGMHSHSVSLNRSGGRATALGVSKLIRAFESKTHHEDDVSDAVPLAEEGFSQDLYISGSKLVGSLKDTLKQMELDIGMVEVRLNGEYNNEKLCEQLEMEFEAQKQQNTILMVKINELVERLSKYKTRTGDLHKYLNEIQQSAIYQSEMFVSQVELLQKEVNDNVSIAKQEQESINFVIIEAIEKLNASSGLLVSENVDIGSFVCASVDAAMSAIKSLQEELEAVHVNYDTLNALFGELNRQYSDIQGGKDFAIGVLNKYYSSLRELVNGSCQDAGEAKIIVNSEEVLPENHEKVIEHLQVLMDERLHLLSINSKLESELSTRNQEIDDLNMRCKALDNEFKDLSLENEKLETVMANERYNFEEVNRRCLALTKKLEELFWDEDLETIPKVAEARESDFYNPLLSRLEALVAFHLHKYEGAIEQINSSRNYLLEICKLPEISTNSQSTPLFTLLQQEFIPQVIELQEKLQLLSASNHQLENEMGILREGLSKMEEALKVAHSELDSKTSELDQSEQKFASVREKLSIAVAKGKGLIVQRESLKQSLMEKSSELEKCTQELLSKEALLHEVEAKLRSCSEVERVEALESELSYIRNSATALRDSFLLKDSVLQRIEEVLEDLDLPEHFHSKDIIEKIELLAQSSGGYTSFPTADWDKKGSVVSHFDNEFVVMDAGKDELPQSSDPEYEDLKRKHEELQRKLYGLAEHNVMLEQSLLESNNLFQKWEEVLNGIDMPSQLRSLEPEDRIEWLKRALAEVHQERDSLQLKIENLEDSSDMLIGDLEESHKKISELNAEVVAIKSEKEFFSESLDKLRYDYLELSEKAVQDEIDCDSLRRELADMQEKLVQNLESKDHDIQKEMWRLHDLIITCLPDNDRFDTLSGGSGTECLEVLLKNLIDSYMILHMEKSMYKQTEKEIVSEERDLFLDKTVGISVSDDKEQNLISLKLELDEATRDMILVKEERNKAIEKCQSLMLELETVSNQRDLLQVAGSKAVEKYQTLELELETVSNERDLLQVNRSKDVEKYQTLELELEAIMKQRDALQELSAQEIEAIREERGLLQADRSKAVEKYQTLELELETVSNQRDLLQVNRSEDVEKYQALELELEGMMKQRDALQELSAQEIEAIREERDLLQEDRTKDIEKYQTLLLDLQETLKQRDSLQEQLSQEVQKSSAAREKLNVAVRKGKGLVQQRDSLKQTIEEMNAALEHLKLEQNQQVEALESEKLLLMRRLTETEHSLQDNNQNLSRLLTALHDIDIVSEVNIVDPVQKIEVIGKLIVSSEHEASKSKRAAELLLAELSEVQERADTLQEELTMAIAARNDALSRLEQFMLIHSEEKKKQINILVGLKSGIYQLKKSCSGFSSLFSNVLTKDMDIFCYMESMLKQLNGANPSVLSILSSSDLVSNYSMKEGRFLTIENDLLDVHEHFDETSITEYLALATSSLHECIREYDCAKDNIHKHSFSIDQQATNLLNAMQTLQRTLASQNEYSESLKRDMSDLKMLIKEKETEISTMQKNVTLLYEACSSSILEIETRRALMVGSTLPLEDHVLGKSGAVLKLPSYIDGQVNTDGHSVPLADDCIRMVADTLIMTVKGSSNISVIAETNERELKATIADLQVELQEKDIRMNRISAELVSQIREAETCAKRAVMDLDSARSQVFTLEKQVEVLENDRKLLESTVNELKDCEASSKELQERFKLLSDALSAKDQEIEALMQALDEEESQMEGLEERNKQLEGTVHEKNLMLERLEASRSKAVSKVSTTVDKFDELHNLSESLLAEIENLQSQLQGRDSEISFLRQEVTRCTDDILTSEETNKKYSSDIHELLKWMNMTASRCGAPLLHLSDQDNSQIHDYTYNLEKKIDSILSELDDLRVKAERKEALLQIERERVQELSCKTEVLESSLREKETQIELYEGRTESGQQASTNSPGHLEIEQVRDNVTMGPIKTHVRAGRKANNDHIAISVDMEKDDIVLEDEDDDKAHGFKSLTMSQIVPRASRPIADRIDGIWVSGERLLMRQPTLRLGVIIYWVALHILLASVI